MSQIYIGILIIEIRTLEPDVYDWADLGCGCSMSNHQRNFHRSIYRQSHHFHVCSCAFEGRFR